MESKPKKPSFFNRRSTAYLTPKLQLHLRLRTWELFFFFSFCFSFKHISGLKFDIGWTKSHRKTQQFPPPDWLKNSPYAESEHTKLSFLSQSDYKALTATDWACQKPLMFQWASHNAKKRKKKTDSRRFKQLGGISLLPGLPPSGCWIPAGLLSLSCYLSWTTKWAFFFILQRGLWRPACKEKVGFIHTLRFLLQNVTKTNDTVQVSLEKHYSLWRECARSHMGYWIHVEELSVTQDVTDLGREVSNKLSSHKWVWVWGVFASAPSCIYQNCGACLRVDGPDIRLCVTWTQICCQRDVNGRFKTKIQLH